jgi:hypothetical protein
MESRKIFSAILFLFILSPVVAQSGSKNKIQLSAVSSEDSSLFKKKKTNSRWHPYAGLHISGDAGMYYIGPSFQIGTDFYLQKKLLLSTYLHYFRDELHTTGENGFFEDGKYRTLTGALLIQLNTSKKITGRSFFIAAGMAIQNRVDTATTSYDQWNDRRTTLLPAFRLGYFFPLRSHKLSIEINGTGPYSEMVEGSGFTEILTQVSLGCRYIF